MTEHPERGQFGDCVQARTVVSSVLADASKPLEDLTVSEWADRHRKVSAESGSPWPGDFKTSRVPYIREVQDCLHPDHPSRRCTARWAAQLGKSTILENWAGFVIDQAPGSMMIVLPTITEAGKFNRIKLQPTIDESPRLKHKVLGVNSRDEQGSTTSYKKFAGGFIQIVSATTSKELQMLSIKYLGMDEVAGYPKDSDGRGSPRDQARARQKMYGDMAKEFQCSTPSEAGSCVISDDFDHGDKRYLYVPCPHCQIYQPLLFENMAGPTDDDRAHFKCLSCGDKILHSQKHEFMPSAKWVPTIPMSDGRDVPTSATAKELKEFLCDPCEGRCKNHQPSWHLWAAYAPKETFDAVWARWTEAQGNTTKLRTFMQQDLAEPYDPGSATVDWEKILKAAQASCIPARKIPSWAGVLVSAADVQGYGIKWSVYAIGPKDQYCLIDRQIFEGAPDQTDEPWIELADALGRKYETVGGSEKGIDLSGVDTGFATQRVYKFCASRPNVYALDGRQDQRAAWLGNPTIQKVKGRGNRIIAKVSLYPVYLYDVKTSVIAALANLVDGANEAGQWPRNTLHIANDLCDEDYCKELTAERLVDPEEEARSSVNRRARNLISPKAKREWKKIAGRQNDWFDVTVYAFALAWHVVTKRHLNAERWNDLLLDVHGKEIDEDLFAAAENSPFVKSANKKQKPKISLADISAQLNR